MMMMMMMMMMSWAPFHCLSSSCLFVSPSLLPRRYVNSDTIDPNLGILRVDSASGEPIATLWNFAVRLCIA